MDDSDYHDAGLAVLGSARGRGSLGSRFTYQNLNCIFTHPKSGAKVFIGNLSAANTKSELEENNITRVVNCQEPSSRNFFEGEPNYQYYRFNIASYRVHEWLNGLLPGNMKPESTSEALAFFLDYFEWVDKCMEDGKSVLVHCFAGAHRAGTAGIGYYMWRKSLENGGTKVDYLRCIADVKQIRPIVNPIGQFTPLLAKLERGINKNRGLLPSTE